MKIRLLLPSLITGAFLLTAGSSLFASYQPASHSPAIQIGDDYATVISVLGEPRGMAGSDKILVLSFDRGEVILRKGEVTSFNLISRQEHAQREERQLAREAELAMVRERRLAEGRALLSERENDPLFRALPASARLAFWDAFRQRYPEIDVTLQHHVVRNEVRYERRQQLAQAQRDRELRELEARVRQAELRAESAEREARLRQRTVLRTHSYYPVFHYHPPVVGSKGHTNRGTRVEVRSGGNGQQAQPPPANSRQQFLQQNLAHVR